MSVLTYVKNLWHSRQRSIDLKILWPECKKAVAEYSSDEPGHMLQAAKAVFSKHAFNDTAWLVLGHDEIVKRIENLK